MNGKTALRRMKHRWLWFLLVGSIGTVLLSLSGLERGYAERVYPNVSVQGVDIGNLALPAARQVLQQAFGEFRRQPFTLSDGERVWRPTPEEAGITVDLAGALAAAHKAGRGDNLLANVWRVAMPSRHRIDLPLRVGVDEAKLRAYLERIAAEVDVPAREATLTVTEHTLLATQSAPGRMVSVGATVRAIQRALATYRPRTVALRIAPLQPQLSTEAIVEARRTVETILSAPETKREVSKSTPYPAHCIADGRSIRDTTHDRGAYRAFPSIPDTNCQLSGGGTAA